MPILSGQGDLNELTKQVNSVTDNLDTADQQLNSQWPAPYVEQDAGSVSHSEYSSDSWQMFLDDDKMLNSELKFGLEPGSLAQTEDMNTNWESSPTTMSSLGDGEGNPNANELPQQFSSLDNSQRDVEDGVRCFEPDPSHLDHADQASNGRIQKGGEPRLSPVGKAQSQHDQAGTSAEACILKKRKAREPIILTKEQEVERMKKKREADKKYRAGITTELKELRSMKPQYDRLMEIVSRFGGIDQMELQINRSNRMESELLRLQQKEVDNDMFRQLNETEFRRLERMKSKYGGTKEMESMLDRFKEMENESYRLKLMKSKYREIEELESMLDKFKDMEAEFHKIDQMKSKFGGIQESESKVDRFKEMEAELLRFDRIKLSFGGIDEIGSGINRLKKIELQFEKHKQMVNQKELESFQASPGSLLDEFDKLRAIASRFGGVENWEHKINQMEAELHKLRGIELDLSMLRQKETEFHRLEQMKYKFGEIEEMESKLHILDQITARLGGIDKIVPEINRLKNIELQHIKYEPMGSHLNQSAQPFFDFPQASLLSL